MLLVLVVAVSHAANIECVGTATQVVKGSDTTFIFKDEIHLRSTLGATEWYKADGSLYASGVDEIYPDEGCYRANGCSFCAKLYTDIEDIAFTVEPSCEGTLLRVTGNFGSLARTYSLSYDALAWNTEEWVDSAAQQSGTLAHTLYLPPLYGATDISLCYDQTVRTALGLDSACVTTTLSEEDVRAVNMQLTSLATTRGKEGEKSNERNRPTSQTLILSQELS